jgi:hypothetical protein
MTEYPAQKIRLMVKAYRDKLEYIDRWDRDESRRADELGMIAALEAAEKYDENPVKAKADMISMLEVKIRDEEKKIKGWQTRIKGAVDTGDYDSAASLKKFIGWAEAEIAKYKREVEFMRAG